LVRVVRPWRSGLLKRSVGAGFDRGADRDLWRSRLHPNGLRVSIERTIRKKYKAARGIERMEQTTPTGNARRANARPSAHDDERATRPARASGCLLLQKNFRLRIDFS